MIDVMLIAPVRAYRDALSAAIDGAAGVTIVGQAASGAEALALLNPPTPAVVLFDFATADVLPALAALRRTIATTQLVAIAVPPEQPPTDLVRAAEAGVSGFVCADQPLSEVVGAILLTVRGQSSCSPRIAAILLRALQRRGGPPPAARPGSGAATPAASLTPRELVVAQLAARGMTNRQIASTLVVGQATVKTHVHSVLRKLGIQRREQIVLADVLELHAQPRHPLWSPPGGGGVEPVTPPA